MNLVSEYIKYRWNVKGRHGTHSPFIYKMVDECFQTPLKMDDLKAVNSLLNQLSKDKRSIQFTDFGAGSKRLNSSRKVVDILKNSSSKGKFARLFYQLSSYYQPQKVLEFGTSLGIGTIHFALGNPEATVTTVEACPQTAQLAKENFEKLKLRNVQLHQQTFKDFLNYHQQPVYDVIFIDGHHDGQATIEYVNALEESMHDQTLVILDDIRWSDGMFQAWKQLVADSRFHVSIDLFRMGILVMRPEQEKEHFVVKL